MLVIPCRDEIVLAEKSIAIEAKVIRPTLKNPGRNANSFGKSQALGLMKDGFPFVALLHLVITESLPDELHWELPFMELGPAGKMVESSRTMRIDPFPIISAKRQEGRLAALQLPGHVAYRAMSFYISEGGDSFSGNSIGQERRGNENPATCDLCIKNIFSLLERSPGLFKHVDWQQ